MNFRHLIPVVGSLIIVAVFLQQAFFVSVPAATELPDVYVGIDVAYEDFSAIKELVNEVQAYTNLFVVGCTGITYNEKKLDEACQYLYDRGFSFIVYSEIPPRTTWIESATSKWGDRFLGFYAFDEVGGKQLDRNDLTVEPADNFTDASNQFVTTLSGWLDWFTLSYPSSVSPTLFTSDYSLYWFDYKAGYDVMLAQLGWNYSRQLNVALCRGAAQVQNKSWGVIVAWTYNSPPYLGSGQELYDDLVLAYDNGADYILVFDSNEDYTGGILQDEHLDALKQFWDYVQDNPRTNELEDSRVAYVLPAGYAYGFRGPDDKVWGLWEADEFACKTAVELPNLLEQYGSELDIIYDDGLDPDNTSIYRKLVFWNGTICEQ